MLTSISRPDWSMIESMVKGSQSRLIICSPWISEQGARKLSEYLSSARRPRCLEIWTRLADVLTDSKGILQLARTQICHGMKVVVRDSKDLHAKIYYSDDSTVVFGSANLSNKAFNNGLEIVASCSAPDVVAQVKTVLDGIKSDTQVVSLEHLEYFNNNQRAALEEAERDTDKPNIVPIWRRTITTPKSEGRLAFLVGSGPKSEKVHLIVKMAMWGQRSINRYDLIDRRRLKKINPASNTQIADFKSRGYEVKEPYHAETETSFWVDYGIEQATKMGLKVEKP